MARAQLPNKIELSKQQLEVLDGAMLGDGSLVKHHNGKNANFSYLSKSKQHVEFVCNYFKEYWSEKDIKNRSYFDIRTNKEYSSYFLRTYTNICFTEQYNRWYSEGIKTIPNDLKLTPLMCLIWYIGDGGICKSNRSEYIKLSTQCFTKEEQELILLPQLQQFEAKLMKTDIGKDGRQQYYIYIPHRKESDFLNYIGDCPFSDYEYKWQYKPYTNAIPKNHTDKEKIFCQLYQQGKTYYQIAKEFNIEPNAVKYYLVKNNIYKSPNVLIKNAVIQYQNNEPVHIFKNMTEASQQTGISLSGISQVCSHKRATAGGYIWKKYNTLSQEEQDKIQLIFIDYFNEERS